MITTISNFIPLLRHILSEILIPFDSVCQQTTIFLIKIIIKIEKEVETKKTLKVFFRVAGPHMATMVI